MSTVPYQITIYERRNPGRHLTAQLGDTPPNPKQGGGGWQIVVLPKRSAVTIWQARDQPLMMDIPIYLGDGIGGQHPANISPLLKMWRPSDQTVEPPVIKLKSPGTVVPYQQLPFVLYDWVWNDTPAQGDEQGRRMLSSMTLTVLEYRQDERLQVTKLKRKRIGWGSGGGGGWSHKVTTGETLTKIAAAYSIDDWRTIGDIQSPPIQDPRSIVVGQILQLPT